ncbi:MAG: SET domain-containing protein [Hyphomicrobium sp.]
MLMVKTRLGVSPIAGIGLFADEDIKAGTVTWRFMPGFDQVFTNADIARLPEPARAQFLTYTYLHKETGQHVYCLDNARFMNHADTPTTAGVHGDGAIEGYDVATRDIAKGEELTCDYHTFDGHVAAKLGSTG